MADLSLQERLQPSLLDRLTDDEPTKTQESREDRVISVHKLRACVLRDLEWLLNCANLSASQDLDGYPQVENSVLNFGMPDMTGQSAISIDASTIEHLLLQAIKNFEPRILSKTLKVKLVPMAQRRHPNSIAFEIEGELWAQPVPQRLFLQTELDLEVGSVVIADQDRPGSR